MALYGTVPPPGITSEKILEPSKKYVDVDTTGEARKGHALQVPLVTNFHRHYCNCCFDCQTGLDEMDNVVLHLEAQIRVGCLWMHTGQVDD